MSNLDQLKDCFFRINPSSGLDPQQFVDALAQGSRPCILLGVKRSTPPSLASGSRACDALACSAKAPPDLLAASPRSTPTETGVCRGRSFPTTSCRSLCSGASSCTTGWSSRSSRTRSKVLRASPPRNLTH
eukprot:765791-Hanusia_phi.AAC.1